MSQDRARCAEILLPPLYSTGSTMKRWHSGRPCKRFAADGSRYCWQHRYWHRHEEGEDPSVPWPGARGDAS